MISTPSFERSDVTEPTLFRFGYGYVGSVGNRLEFFDRPTEIESTELIPKLCRLWRLRRFNSHFARNRICRSFENFSNLYVNNFHKGTSFDHLSQSIDHFVSRPLQNKLSIFTFGIH